MKTERGVLGWGEDEVFCLILGWALVIFGLMVFPIAGPGITVVIGLGVAAVGVWLLVEAFVHYAVPRLLALHKEIKEGSWTQLLALL